MSEIEKLYKNAGVERVIPDVCSNYEGDCIGCKAYIKGHKPYCTEAEYPPFTPEKQLNLIMCLVTKILDSEHLHIEVDVETNKICIHSLIGQSDDCDTIEDALASYINEMWQDLTEQERTQIAEILRG